MREQIKNFPFNVIPKTQTTIIFLIQTCAMEKCMVHLEIKLENLLELLDFIMVVWYISEKLLSWVLLEKFAVLGTWYKK